MRLVCLLVTIVLVDQSSIVLASESPLAPSSNENDTLIEVDYKVEGKESKSQEYSDYSPQLENIFKNSAITIGLENGTEVINKSIDSIMDSVFYNILNYDQIFPLTDSIRFQTGFRRKVYPAQNGSYIVVDRFYLGPGYTRQIAKYRNIPLTIGADGSAEILQIYLRSDGLRLSEQEDLSPTRVFVNNMFGLIPILAAILPPSFNQNQLYDPITEILTPLSFPFDFDSFYQMPIGSIRSYAISGGINIAADIAGIIPSSTKNYLTRIGNFAAVAPYSVFKQGEHRINVFRRNKDLAWVGVRSTARIGQQFSSSIGAEYSIFRGLFSANIRSPPWVYAGVPIVALPVEFSIERANADLYDQVYEYDLRNSAARKAYLAAVKGDFVLSKNLSRNSPPKSPSGVQFHFERQQKRREKSDQGGPNIGVYREIVKKDHAKAEIEITDINGKFYVLEASQETSIRNWDILVGDQEYRIQNTVEMQVKPVWDHSGHKVRYLFEKGVPPYMLSININLLDKYTNAEEYRSYIYDLRYLTGLDLNAIPTFSLRDEHLVEARRQKLFFSAPDSSSPLLHIPPTPLGKFNAQVKLFFSFSSLEKVLRRKEAEVWSAFGQAYGFSKLEAEELTHQSSFAVWLREFISTITYPLKLLNLQASSIDVVHEITKAVQAINHLRIVSTPEDKLVGFLQLIDTSNPRQLIHALLLLAGNENVYREVKFSTTENKQGPAKERAEFSRLNSVSIAAGPRPPQPSRYARTREKIAQFYLDKPQNALKPPRIESIKVMAKSVPFTMHELEDSTSLGHDSKHFEVYVSIQLPREEVVNGLKIYLRLEQGGRLKLGKLELGEKVLNIRLLEQSDLADGKVQFGFYLTGPLSPLRGFFFDQMTEGNQEYLMAIAASRDGETWGGEKTVEFRFENNKLYPILPPESSP